MISISVDCLDFSPKASEGSDSEKAEGRRFELHYDSLVSCWFSLFT